MRAFSRPVAPLFCGHSGSSLQTCRSQNNCYRSFVQRCNKQSLHTFHDLHARPLASCTNVQVAAPSRNGSRNISTPQHAFFSSTLARTAKPLDEKYTPPQRGVVGSLPKSWIPYAELIRLDKPTGTYYLFFPCAFSTLVAAQFASSAAAAPLHVVSISGLFFLGALVMRGAGCTINDLWDRNLDPHVKRTKFRPIARGAITPRSAVFFTGVQLLLGLGVLLQFPYQCLFYGIPSLLLVSTYPLAKRVTNYPQVVLGLTFSWGAMMGFPALGVDLLSNSDALMAATALYSSCVIWTVLYDMIYAHMDIKYDAAAGIKSIALKHEHNTKAVLSSLAAVQVGLLAAVGAVSNFGPVFFIGSCGSAIATLGTMIWRVRLKDAKNCWWWFRNGCWLTGGGITLGLVGEYLAEIFGWYGATASTSEPEHAPLAR